MSIDSETNLAELKDIPNYSITTLNKKIAYHYLPIVIMVGLILASLAWAWLTRKQQFVNMRTVLRPQQMDKVYTKWGGTIKSAQFEEGDHVKKGDVLVTFESEDLNSKLETQQSKKQSLMSKRTNLRNLIESNRDRMKIIRQQTASRRRKLEKQLQNARANYQANLNLYQQNKAVSETKLDESKARVDDLQSELDSLNHNRGTKLQQLQRQINDLQSRINEVNGTIGGINTKIKTLNRKLSESHLKAGATGQILRGQFYPGEFVPPGTKLYTIASIERLKLLFYATNDQRSRLEPGQPVTLRVTTYPVDEYGTLKGTVQRLSSNPVEDSLTEAKGYEIKVSIDSTKDYTGELYPGLGVRADVLTGKKRMLTMAIEWAEDRFRL